LALGCTVKELLSRIDSQELSEWLAYYSIEPFGEWRADLRQAITSMIIANVNRSKKSRAYKVKEFMPFEKQQRRKQQTPEQMQAMLNLLC